nr:gamma-glutamyltransferase [Mesorhizobium sp. NFR06]
MANDHAPKVGSRFSTPALGRTLSTIARGGAKAFYEGEIGAEIASTVQALGGFLTREDLASVTADWVEPISASFAGHDIFEIPRMVRASRR